MRFSLLAEAELLHELAIAVDVVAPQVVQETSALAERGRRDVRDALRAGATTTPTVFAGSLRRGRSQRSER